MGADPPPYILHRRVQKLGVFGWIEKGCIAFDTADAFIGATWGPGAYRSCSQWSDGTSSPPYEFTV